jgi:hypothetical protein
MLTACSGSLQPLSSSAHATIPAKTELKEKLMNWCAFQLAQTNSAVALKISCCVERRT